MIPGLNNLLSNVGVEGEEHTTTGGMLLEERRGGGGSGMMRRRMMPTTAASSSSSSGDMTINNGSVKDTVDIVVLRGQSAAGQSGWSVDSAPPLRRSKRNRGGCKQRRAR